MPCQTATQPSQPTQLTSRNIHQCLALLENLEQQRQAKRTRYPTHGAEEPDEDADSTAPVYDMFLESQGPNGIHSMTNFSPAEFNLQWSDVRNHAFKHWNVGSGRKTEVSARDMLLMLLTPLKHCGTWDVVAAVFKQKTATFEKRVKTFLRKYIQSIGEKWSMLQLVSTAHHFQSIPFARYAMGETFQQTNIPCGSYAEKK
ncbi:hypothetical protein H310_13906 [Aphanomyces invadans]|uniref:Uncharacterized protein n=1 Tax=Aphanomyces invadans TaxID=157072 RepID=A0A024TBI1_9STRA|nr:hypothetical protein H310_13906 [Aphanomyces invadans]ETV91510.1 hypothetical protein H310_13906 [Aphanomyces invadans]|eukprot:XP_008879778.1 hypothetical protein H310_13906 [Aphanomyces invadans]